MARYKSGLLSSMGAGFEILKAIIDAVIQRGGTDDDVRRILRDKKLRNAIADLIFPDQKRFVLIVDYDIPYWKELLDYRLCGEYTGVSSILRLEHFPISRSGRWEFILEYDMYPEGIRFEDYLTICKDNSVLEMDRAIAENFFDEFPNESKKGWILAPCVGRPEFNGEVRIAYVGACNDKFYLRSEPTDHYWDYSTRFLRICEARPLD